MSSAAQRPSNIKENDLSGRQALNGFSAVTDRLDLIEGSLAKLVQQTSSRGSTPSTSLDSQKNTSATNPSRKEVGYFVDSRESSKESVSQPSSVHHDGDGSGGEQFYGATSLLSPFKAAYRRLAENLENDLDLAEKASLRNVTDNSPWILSELRSKIEAFPFKQDCGEPVFCGDGKAVELPPRSFVDSSIDSFLAEINLYTPIFEDARLREAIEMRYSGLSVGNAEAWNLCFNNIILLVMCLSSRVTRYNSSDFAGGIEDDIVQSFLKTSHRALQKLDSFSSPSLVHVQALCTLAMVAREYYESRVFTKLLPRACHIIRSIGQQQSFYCHNLRLETEDVGRERKSLFWALYVMDKQRCFMSGQPCDLHLFDSDIDLAFCKPGRPIFKYLRAQVHLMSLWEEIYITLYSPRAIRQGQAHRNEQAPKLDSSLWNWSLQYKDLMGKPALDAIPAILFIKLELKYCFNVGRVLIYRRVDEHAGKEQCRESAKLALRIIADVHKLGPSPGAVALRGRLFRSYPMISFIELFELMLDDPVQEAKGAASILHAVYEALLTLQHPQFPTVYYSRLLEGMAWCLGVVDVFKDTTISGNWPDGTGSSVFMRGQTVDASPTNQTRDIAQRPEPTIQALSHSYLKRKSMQSSQGDDEENRNSAHPPPYGNLVGVRTMELASHGEPHCSPSNGESSGGHDGFDQNPNRRPFSSSEQCQIPSFVMTDDTIDAEAINGFLSDDFWAIPSPRSDEHYHVPFDDRFFLSED
ncbi:MAG: hypothetical protein M1819_002504 [Sarea resinae]|nr:MAG: hypothetical protein M1819_002504 [Sarea resinae]